MFERRGCRRRQRRNGAADALRSYLRDIRRAPLLNTEEEQATAALAGGNFAAGQRMIERILRLIVSIARHCIGRGLALTDLIEEGNLGLMHAISKFEPERGFRFFTTRRAGYGKASSALSSSSRA